jgi:type IV pilus assembly protein PilC
MQTYKYVALTGEGKRVTGSVQAEREDEAVSQLQGQSLTILSISQGVGGAGSGSKAVGAKRGFAVSLQRIKLDDLVLFTRQMATMIGAGIPLLEALEIMEEQVENKRFSGIVGQVVRRVAGGGDFSEALAEHPKVFNRIFINMVRSGEASGQLDTILVRLADYLESAAALRREIKSAMTYPVVSLVLIFGITIFLMVGIIPKFNEIFTQMEVELPALTVFMLTAGLWMRDYFLVFMGVIAAIVAAIALYSRTTLGKRHKDWLVLHVPIFGPLFQKVAISRFSRTLSTLLDSGVPILGALEIVATTAGNSVVEDAINRARENVRQGENLAQPLSESWVFPPMVTRMIAVGERSGALETLLRKISEFYDQQVSATVESLTSLIEPLMIGIMGGLVGTIVLSVFWPILKLQQALSSQ